jgi:hypothetical protein
MNSRGVCPQWITIAICAALATSCSTSKNAPPAIQQSSAPAQPAAQPAAQSAPVPSQPAPAPPTAPGNVIASGEYTKDPGLRCDLLEVKRVSGGALLVKWRVVNAAGQAPGGLTAAQPKPIHYYGDWGQTPPWSDIYFIDPAENKKYAFLTDAAGANIADVFWGDLPAGEQRGNWAKFPAPPPTSTKISVHIPSFAPFEDVPVS